LAISTGKDNSMVQNLKACVIQIQDSDGTVYGTGFIIDANTAVTCAHVVEAAGAAPGETVTITFALTGDTCPAEALADAWRPASEADIAILCLQSELPIGVTPAILGPSDDTAGHSFRAFGYPKVGDIQGVWAEGKILGPITDSQDTTMLQLDSQQVAQGMSGGPVLDTDSDRVVGMITATYHPDDTLKFRDAAFATPIETIVEVWPSLELTPPSPTWVLPDKYKHSYLNALTDAYRVFFRNRFVHQSMEAVITSEPTLPDASAPAELATDMLLVELVALMDQPESSTAQEMTPSQRSSDEVEMRPIANLHTGLAEYRTIALLGEPGSGKTSALLWVLGTWSSVVAESHTHRLPIFVSLNRYISGTFEDFLTKEWHTSLVDALRADEKHRTTLEATIVPLADSLEDYLATGQVVLLLDALNELPRGPGYL
jgi:hypothetical protein